MGRPGRDIGRRGLREDVGRRVDVGRVGGTLLGRQGGEGFVYLGRGSRWRFFGLLAPAGHERLVARHAEDALGCAGIAQVLDLALAVPASEAVCTEGLVAREDGQILDLVAAVVAAICAVVAYQRAVAEQQQVRVRVEEGTAGVAAEAVDVPSVTRCLMSVCHSFMCVRLWLREAGRREGGRGCPCLNGKCRCIPSSKAFPSSSISPHPLHGYTTSSWSSGDSGYAPGDSMVLYGDVSVCVCERRSDRNINQPHDGLVIGSTSLAAVVHAEGADTSAMLSGGLRAASGVVDVDVGRGKSDVKLIFATSSCAT
jgi:hypothetical protein